MNKIIIVSPHFPPSNLVGVHRARFLSKYLPNFGWEPIIVCIHEKYYEEKLDYNLLNLVRPTTRIEKVKALKTKPVRIIGDVGLRGFFQMLFRILSLCKKEKISFLYISVPSFWAALLGRIIHDINGIPYGIDYQDPWVHFFPGSEKTFSRHWWSTKLARLLEPIAVKKASLITGVNRAYYDGVISRNPFLKKRCLFADMPIGIDPDDFERIEKINKSAYIYNKNDKIKIVYAGTILPKAHRPLDIFLKAVSENKDKFKDVEFYFIGTGKTPNDPEGYRVKPVAEKYELWQSIIFEYPQRIPYLDVLIHLRSSSGVFILGSSEPHYSPSKVYQAILSGKPIFALLLDTCNATDIIIKSKAGIVLTFNSDKRLHSIEEKLIPRFSEYMNLIQSYKNNENLGEIESYTAKSITKTLVNKLDLIC